MSKDKQGDEVEKEEEKRTVENEKDTNEIQGLLFDEIEAEYEAEEDYGATDGAESLSSSDEIVRAVANILKKSDEIKASDIHIEPQENELRIRYKWMEY